MGCQLHYLFALHSVMIIVNPDQGGCILRKLWYRVCLTAFLVLSLSGCSAIRDIGHALTNGLKGFSIHFP